MGSGHESGTRALCYSAPPLKQAYVHSLFPLDFPPPGLHGHNDNVYLVLAHGVEPKSPDYKSGALPLSYTSMFVSLILLPLDFGSALLIHKGEQAL